MNETLKALILGVIQGLAEFLPVSSSGHIELGKVALGLDVGLDFSVLVHIATALSTLLVFRKDIASLAAGIFSSQQGESLTQIGKLVFSAVPVGLVGIFFKEKLEIMFEGNLLLVGSALLLTALLLFLTTRVPRSDGEVTWLKAFLMGLAQMLAIVPGISRSGATISTALLLKVDPVKAARFSFLMVLIPILGAALVDILELARGEAPWRLSAGVAAAGFFSAFGVGIIACSAMMRIVRQGKLYWFSLYCLVIGLIAIGLGLVK